LEIFKPCWRKSAGFFAYAWRMEIFTLQKPAVCKTGATEGQSVTGRQLHENKNEIE
jgi:hypothetical protein